MSGVTKQDEQCDPNHHAISYTEEPGSCEPHSVLGWVWSELRYRDEVSVLKSWPSTYSLFKMKYQFSNHGRQPTVCSRVEVGSGEACSRRNDRYRFVQSYTQWDNTYWRCCLCMRQDSSGSLLWMLTVSNNKFSKSHVLSKYFLVFEVISQLLHIESF